MRFAIATVDRYLGVFETFVRAGWQPLKVFTIPVETRTDNHRAVTALGRDRGAEIKLTRLDEVDLRHLSEQGCDVLVVACYPWKIGPWQNDLPYAVNIHSSPLPEARGPYPHHRVILDGHNEWAVTCHRLSDSFDAGDILTSETFALQSDESHESLDLKIQMAAKRLTERLTGDFIRLWDHATPQDRGSYWPAVRLSERLIDFTATTDAVLRRIRAFGDLGSLVRIGSQWIAVTRAIGWRETHTHCAGTVAHIHDRTLVVAASDGYVALLDAGMASAEFIAALHHDLRSQSHGGAAMPTPPRP